MLAFFGILSLSFFAVCMAGPIRIAPAALTKRDSQKYVVAHHMVGNTYIYTQDSWLSDILLAYQHGIDAFALNVGSDSWQPAQVKFAYQAALQSGTSFKLFLSFDMTSLPCADANDSAILRDYITNYASHPNQLIYNGRVFASAFSGESCQFGQDSAQSGWLSEFVQQLTGENAVHFTPSFFVDPSTLQGFSKVIDGLFVWNSAWPTQLKASSLPDFAASTLQSLTTYVGATAVDEQYISSLNDLNGTYMASVSPCFFTHYSPQTYDKNWIYLYDDHLYVRRWEQLIEIRDQVDIVQIISWNDFGESHYIGPIEGVQPNSEQWVNGFNHTGWLEMTSYYATAFKTGIYPTIQNDQIFMWSRPHPTSAIAPDPVGPPANYQLASDKIWALVLATSPGNVTLSTSPTLSQTFSVPAGATKLSLPIFANGFMKALMERGGVTVIDLQAEGFYFNPSPASYNFNSLVVSSNSS